MAAMGVDIRLYSGLFGAAGRTGEHQSGGGVDFSTSDAEEDEEHQEEVKGKLFFLGIYC